MAIPSTPLFKQTAITGDAVIKAASGKIWAVLLTGAAATCLLEFYNHASSATGDVLLSVAAPFTDADGSSNSSVYFDFTSIGGIDFSTGIYVDHTGSDAVGYVWTS